MTEKLYGTFEEGIGEILPATSEARTLKVQFRSNKKKNAGGFRCQVSPQCGSLVISSDLCSNYRVWIWLWSRDWHCFWVILHMNTNNDEIN